MKKLFFIMTLVLVSSCDYRNYPQEQEWKEDIQEMNQDKKEDPRKYDEVQEREEDRREVNADEIIWTPANQ